MENNEPTSAAPETPAADITTSSTESRQRLSAARRYAIDQYDKIRSATASQIQGVRDYTHTARQQLNEQFDETYDKAKELHKAGEEYVRQKPTHCVLGALGVGLILGLLLGRKN